MSDPMINVNKFRTWKATMDNQSILEYVYDGNLNKVGIARACQFGSGALKKNGGNKQLIKEFNNYQDSLREEKVLPELTKSGKKIISGEESVPYNQNEMKDIRASKRNSQLEAENTQLKAENEKLKIKLEQLKDLSETLSELGVIYK
jgi:hypothetical protein